MSRTPLKERPVGGNPSFPMELIITDALDVWYGLFTWDESEYDDEYYEDARGTDARTAGRGKRNAPVRRGTSPLIHKSNASDRGSTLVRKHQAR